MCTAQNDKAHKLKATISTKKERHRPHLLHIKSKKDTAYLEKLCEGSCSLKNYVVPTLNLQGKFFYYEKYLLSKAKT